MLSLKLDDSFFLPNLAQHGYVEFDSSDDQSPSVVE